MQIEEQPTIDSDTAQQEYITVLKCRSPLILTKRLEIGADGKLHSADKGTMPKWYSVSTVPVANLRDVETVTGALQPDEASISGRLKEGVDPKEARRVLHPGFEKEKVEGKVRFKLDAAGAKIPYEATIEDRPSHILRIDAEGLHAKDNRGEFDPIAEPARAIRCLAPHLPPELRLADCAWQWSASAGTAGHEGEIRIHLAYWLSRPLTAAQVKAWLQPWLKSGADDREHFIDPTLYSPDHLLYGAPVLPEGIADPIAQRTGFCPCVVDHVKVPDDLPSAAEVVTKGKNLLNVTDRPTAPAYAEEDRDTAIRLLPGISPAKVRDEWVPIVAAINAVFGGDDEGRGVALRWMRGGFWRCGGFTPPADAQYREPDQVEAVYHSFTGNAVAGLGTLRQAAAEEGWPPVEWKYGPVPEVDIGDDPAEAATIAAIEWGEPADLFGYVTPEPSFDAEAMLPAPIARYAISAAPVFGSGLAENALPALFACAVALDARHQLRINDEWFESAREWFARVDQSGSNKTAPINSATKQLDALWKQQRRDNAPAYAEHKAAVGHEVLQIVRNATGDSTVSAAPIPPAPAYRDLIINNCTSAGLRDLLARSENEAEPGVVHDELSVLFSGFDGHGGAGGHQAGQGMMVKLWEGLPFHDRLANDRGKARKIDVARWGASVIGNIQEVMLQRYLKDIVGDGYLSRFLLFSGSPREVPDHGAQIDREAFDETVKRLFDLGPGPTVTRLGAEARRLFELVERAALAAVERVSIDPLKLAIAKMPRQFARLLMLYHAIDCVDTQPLEPVSIEEEIARGKFTGRQHLLPEVGGECAWRAFRLLRDFLWPEVERIYHKLYVESDREEAVPMARRGARMLLGYGQGVIDDRTLAKKVRALREKEELRQAAARYLVERHWLHPIKGTEAHPLSRYVGYGKVIRWAVNPAVFTLNGSLAEVERKRQERQTERDARVDRDLRNLYVAA